MRNRFVCLSDEDIDLARDGGSDRYSASDRMGLAEQEITREHGRGLHVCGALAEVAFARWLGVDWSPKVLRQSLVDQDDVAGLEVRSTVLPCPCGNPDGCLRLNKRGTKPECVYVLVIRRGRWFEMAGWIVGRDGMLEDYWGRHYQRSKAGWSEYCYGVPRADINPDMDLIYQLQAGRRGLRREVNWR